MAKPDNAGQTDKLLNFLEHGQLKAAENMKGVDLHIDDPLVRNETFTGTDGVHDVFVFNAGVPHENVTNLYNFDPGEDYFLFQNLGEGRDVVVGDLGLWSSGEPIGFNFVLFHGNGASANLIVHDMPYQHDPIEVMVLPTNTHLVFDDPFLV